MIKIGSSPKKYSADTDKSIPPDQTADLVRAAFAKHDQEILSSLDRIDTGRLDIPVYMSICGSRAREAMPVRKQMGKGSTPAQAQASALMELVERYSFFSFVSRRQNFNSLTWSEAAELYQDSLIPVQEIIKSVQEDISPEAASRILSLVEWDFTPATRMGHDQEYYIPFNWFRKLNEFNGCSAGNTFEESILQGACELIERHCCAQVHSQKLQPPVIDQSSCSNPVLRDLLDRFRQNSIHIHLMDFTLDMPLPTVAALAYDPASFPSRSEIVYTAGTAASPEKAAIRAVTEVAQLAGDFESGSCYEASGLPKFISLEQIRPLTRGPLTTFQAMPDISSPDMGQELKTLCLALEQAGYGLYSLSTEHPGLGISANYNIIPGFNFRERTPNACLGLITGRILAEEADPLLALNRLEQLAEIYPRGFFIPFHQGLVHNRLGLHSKALELFTRALEVQPDEESSGLCAFYCGYTLTLEENWAEALPFLSQAINFDPGVKEYFNLRGVAFYRQKDYEAAMHDFNMALSLDKGSAVDLANLGLCRLAMGRKEEAAANLAMALELDPGLDFAQKKLSELIL